MSKSNKITELNQLSQKLTDAELAMVEKFSVLLPMNELPEIVIANSDQAGYDSRSEIDAQEADNESGASSSVANANASNANASNAGEENKSGENGVPEGAIIPFQKASPDPEDSSSEAVNEADGERHEDRTGAEPTNVEKQDAIEERTVEFPQDELSISGRPDEAESDQEHADAEEAIFDIVEHGRYHDRVESVAASIESGLNPNQPATYVLVSPTNSPDQELIFNSLLLSIANKKPDRKIIGVQAIMPQLEDSGCSVGLGHVLSEEYLLEDVVVPTSSDNLDYLAFSECSISNSSYKNRIHRMLEELKKHYDLVFVNAGVAASSETLSLADSADAFYMLIRMADAEQDPVVQAAAALRKKGARLAGCILSGYQKEAS